MINVNELTVGQAREIASEFGSNHRETSMHDNRLWSIQIVVLISGFVYVGTVTTDNGWVTITNAKNIRKWGTSNGLGELVNGPMPSTILDDVGELRAPFHALIHMINVEQDKWKM